VFAWKRPGEKGVFQKLPRFYRESIAFVATCLVICIFVLSVITNGTINVSAVYVDKVGVYKDRNCSEPRSSIDWGTLTPGSVKSRPVYIRNEFEEPIFFILLTMDWTPPNASKHMKLRWNYTERRVDFNETLQIELRLFVDLDIKGISSFSFDIRVTGSENLPGDLNGDDLVDIVDLVIVTLAYATGDLRWNTLADANEDGVIDIGDVTLVSMHYGETV